MSNPFDNPPPAQTRVVKFILSWVAIFASVACLVLKELGLSYAFSLLAVAIANAPRTWRPS
jgi:hypothetical protein